MSSGGALEIADMRGSESEGNLEALGAALITRLPLKVRVQQARDSGKKKGGVLLACAATHAPTASITDVEERYTK